jgi:selenoprotein W-related protein
LTDTLLNAYKTKIAALTLVPSRGGCFEVRVDGELVYSKLATGEFPNEAAVADAVGKRLKK